MVINQGDIFWVNLDEPIGSEPGYQRPFVVIQKNILNHSQINTVLGCPITSNLKRANDLGNVLLNKGEANLPKQSVVNVSQTIATDKFFCVTKIGTLSQQRVQEIVNGLRSITDPTW